MKFSELSTTNFDDFLTELQKHFDDEGNLFTEDLIRYWFIQFFKDKDKGRKNTQIEMPYNKKDAVSLCPNHPQISNRSRADLCYYYKNDEYDVIEFKYHRKTLYSSSCTATNLGSVLNDFNRLSVLDTKKHKYLIYLFDEKMKDYYNKNHTNVFPMFCYDNIKINNTYEINTKEISPKNMSEILKNAFASFYDKNKYEDILNNYDFNDFCKEVKILYKNTIQDNFNIDKNKNNLYIIIYEIIKQ